MKVSFDKKRKSALLGITQDRSFIERKTEKYSLAASFGAGWNHGNQILNDYASQLKFIFTKKGAESLGGFITIANIYPDTWNWSVFWTQTAFISFILAFMNLLPIPALDGGHVLFLLVEMVIRRPLPQKFLEYAQMVGIFLLLGLMLYANGNDVVGLFKK
jgi:regulator of sigma E protease